jgi:hypothetical protein
LDELCAKLTDGSIREVLQNLPRDLGETYCRLLARVEDTERRAYVQNMFRWIIFARRPLKVDELREAIAFDINDTEWDQAKIPSELLRLIRSCGNLILINDETKEVQLAHYTVEQYLLDRDDKFRTDFHIRKGESNWKLAQICVAYLSFSDFETQIVPYNDATTPKFAPIENAVMNQSLLTMGSTAAAAVRIITKLRGEKRLPSNIEYARHIPIQPPQSAPITLTKKYHLLSYVIDEWLSHSRCFTLEASTESQDTRGRLLFEDLVLEKSLLFQIRPWESIPVRKDPPYLAPLGWAISSSHLPLLETIFAKNTPERYLDFAIRSCWQEEQLRDPNISQDLLHAWRTYPLDITRNVGDWGTWLYCQLLRAAQDGKDKAIKAFFMDSSNRLRPLERSQRSWVKRLISHLVLEAAISNKGEIVAWLCSIRRISVWLTCDYDSGGRKIPCCNAIEHAALLGHGKIIGILLQLCPVSDSFAEEVLIGGLLSAIVRSRDTNKLKCLLKILSEPLHAAERLKKALPPAPNSPNKSLDSQVKPRRLGLFSRSSSAKTDTKTYSQSDTGPKALYVGKLKAVLTAASLGDEIALGELFNSRVTEYENKSTALDEHHGALLCAIANDNAKAVEYVLKSGKSFLPYDFLASGFALPSHDKTLTDYTAFYPKTDMQVDDTAPLDFAIGLAKTDVSGVKYQAIIDLLLGYKGPMFASPEERDWLVKESCSRKRYDRRTRLEEVVLDGKDSCVSAPQPEWEPFWAGIFIFPVCVLIIWVIVYPFLPST